MAFSMLVCRAFQIVETQKKDSAVRNIEVTKVGFLVASEDDLRLRWYKLNGYPFEHVRLPL